MRLHFIKLGSVPAFVAVLAFGATLTIANATEPCGDFGECKVLVEINASDGDIGFHFLGDGDELIRMALFNPYHRKIYSYVARREARRQTLTEGFIESAEPLCWPDPEAIEDLEPGEELEIVTLEDFVDRWHAGTYHFVGISPGWDLSFGQTDLSFDLPAAPAEVEFELDNDDGDIEGEISWEPGNDLGECANYEELVNLVAEGVLPTHPADVPVAAWEVVLEPDVDDGDIVASFTHVVRISGDAEELEVEIPDDYLETLPNDTLVKVEVGAIGIDDNATFTEEDGFCVNEVDGCDD